MLPQNNLHVQEINRFLEPFFEELGAEQRIELRHRLAGEGHQMRREFFASVQDAASRVLHLRNSNVYVGVATRLGEDGTKKGVCRIPALWADLDAKKDHTRESRLRQLADLSCYPSILIWTGGGWHAYWLLTTPAENPKEMEEAELVMRRLAAALDSDPVHDRTRIMRMPGSLNHKYGKPRCAQIEHCDPDCRYELAGLREMAEALSGEDSGGAAESGNVPREVLSEPIREHRRNLSLTSVAGSLRDRGLDVETIGVVLLHVNRLRCAPPLTEQEVLGIARSMGRYSAGQPRYRSSRVKRVSRSKRRK